MNQVVSSQVMFVESIQVQVSKVVVGDGKVFEKELVKGRGARVLAKAFTLPDVEVGCVIEYFFTIDFDEHRLFASSWILSNELFTKKAQFSLKPYQGTYVRYTLRWSWHDLPAGAEPKEGSDHIIRMEARNIPAFQTEDYMPPPNELKSRVNLIYEEGIAEKDQDSFWKRIGKLALRSNPGHKHRLAVIAPRL